MKREQDFLTCTWNSVTESSSICTRMANFLPLRLFVDAVPSTPDGVLSECVIRPVPGVGPIESNDISSTFDLEIDPIYYENLQFDFRLRSRVRVCVGLCVCMCCEGCVCVCVWWWACEEELRFSRLSSVCAEFVRSIFILRLCTQKIAYASLTRQRTEQNQSYQMRWFFFSVNAIPLKSDDDHAFLLFRWSTLLGRNASNRL